MWKPDEVVDEHRSWARRIWVLLLLGISALIVHLVIEAVQDRASPSKSFAVSDDKYDFPVVLVCLEDGSGCDVESEDWDVDYCVKNAIGAADFAGQRVNATVSTKENRSNCVEFDLSSFDVGEGPQDPSSPTQAVVTMDWPAGDGGGATNFMQSLSVYMVDGKTGQFSSQIYAPYSRIQYYVDGHSNTNIVHWIFLSIGRTNKQFLDKDKDHSFYSALTLSTVDKTHTADPMLTSNSSSSDGAETESYVHGNLFLEITQDPLSYWILKEIDPTDIEGLFGTVGGLWEFILLTWGLIFASSSGSSPHLRIRDFTEPFKKVQGLLSGTRSKSVNGEEAIPEWDTTATRMEDGTLQEIKRDGTNRWTVSGNSPIANGVPQPLPTAEVHGTFGASQWHDHSVA